MEVSATLKNIRHSPRKVRLVVNAVRGKRVDDALAILRYMPQHSARDVAAVLASARANAENNLMLSPETLYIKEIAANEAPRMKRIHARARGRADRVIKRMSHVTVTVEEREEQSGT
ncbi:MAG: 50S ribosomal protein L22 [Chloroflexota bacterium]|nr:50S ribosomal protein L22 [Chloroflexota bacterium]